MHEGKLIRRVARFRQMYLSEFEGQSLVERRLGGSNVCEGGFEVGKPSRLAKGVESRHWTQAAYLQSNTTSVMDLR